MTTPAEPAGTRMTSVPTGSRPGALPLPLPAQFLRSARFAQDQRQDNQRWRTGQQLDNPAGGQLPIRCQPDSPLDALGGSPPIGAVVSPERTRSD
jgi:hypothetical protein